ncbi:hypothetical protein [Streptococcus mitis]|uniref:hypothetical protein n=1 Tax=Streptococcus mitis TaxID=28037 RepID=UPI002001462C|nr:hypothetical protein [Streptococcus mitis]
MTETQNTNNIEQAQKRQELAQKMDKALDKITKEVNALITQNENAIAEAEREKTQLLQDQATAQREYDEAVDEVDKDKLRSAKDNLWIAESKLKKNAKKLEDLHNEALMNLEDFKAKIDELDSTVDKKHKALYDKAVDLMKEIDQIDNEIIADSDKLRTLYHAMAYKVGKGKREFTFSTGGARISPVGGMIDYVPTYPVKPFLEENYKQVFGRTYNDAKGHF